MPQIAVIIPHKRMPENDKSLMLNIDMLLSNSKLSLEILIDSETPSDPYRIYNELAEKARSDVIVFTNSDVLMAPGWDYPFWDHVEYNSIVTGYLVEAGNVGVADVNVAKDCGKTPDAFNRIGFEQYVSQLRNIIDPGVKEERAWYMPCAMHREWFLSTGGFDLSHGGFPAPIDIEFWNHCRDVYHTKFLRVNSFAYHFQAMTHRGY